MDASIAMLLLRIVVGLLLLGHGTQKLFGWFGGGGPAGTGGMLRSLGYPAPSLAAIGGGLAEAVGGALLALGLLVPFAAFLLVVMMASAIGAVHLRNGMWNQNGGIEFPLVVATVAVAAAIFPGMYSLDHAIGATWDGVPGGVTALALGLLVAGIGLALRRTRPNARPTPAPASTPARQREASGTSPTRPPADS